ncbi:MAG: tRNA pseudouridine(38-40) synthase TruA [Planctomycetota bacterium]|nr:tRNA pseudouridine(38-40) synthase TruA [Planctomycetota bacterium]
MPRYRFIVAYDGTDFFGWQKQNRPEAESLRTAQEELENSLIEILHEPIRLVGASRTDSGVHARGQVAACTAEMEIDPENLLFAVNSALPKDLQVRSVEVVEDSFHPINDCTSKGYRYTLAHGCRDPRRTPLFDRHFVAFTAYELNVALMQNAANFFKGKHDFAGFTKLNHGRESTVRRVDDCSVHAISDSRIAIDVAGQGFLWNMVRIMAGTLLEVGREKISPDEIPAIIESRDRSRAGKTLPAEGLCLEWVSFETHSPNKLAISK